MKKVVAYLTLLCMTLTLFTACGAKNKIVINADREILDRFSGYLSPDEVLKDVSNIDFYHEMNTDGLTAKKEKDEESDTVITYYSDKKGNLVYEKYDGFGEKGFAHYTKSKSGKPLEVKYYYGFHEDINARDVIISSDEYTARFYETDKTKEYGAKYVEASVTGKEKGLIHENITYIFDNDVLDDDKWSVSANYLDDDGMHSYDKYYDSDEEKYEYYDYILFKKEDNVQVTDIKSMIDYFGEDVYMLEMQIASVPFYTEKDGKMKWYYGGELSFIFDSQEQADDFSKKFGGETDYMGDEDEGYSYIVVVDNPGLPIADDAEDFDPYSYTDINDWYSVTPKFNENWELTGVSSGMISYY